MAEERTMKLNIDASGAEAGAEQFRRALAGIAKASKDISVTGAADIKKLTDVIREARAPSSDTIDRIKSFKQAITNMPLVSNQVVGGVSGIKVALDGFKGPSQASVNSLAAFSNVIRHMVVPNDLGARLAMVGSAMSTFKPPSMNAVTNMAAFSRTLGSMKLPTNMQAIIQGLDHITAAANRAAQAMNSLHGISLSGIAPRGGGGGGGSGGGGGGGNFSRRQNQGYGPRTNAYMYDGILSGEHRAVGEMRGFENIVNPSFQAASLARVGVAGGALTAGEGLKGLFNEGSEMIKYQHMLEIVTADQTDAAKSNRDLNDMMSFGTGVAEKYGLSLEAVRNSFAKFAVAANSAGFSQSNMKQIFEDMSVAMRSMGADGEAQTKIYRALDQIMQTGHVSMLQLHKEIGLQMPAIQIMAKALGVTVMQVEEMSRKGQLGSESLTKFAAAAKEMYLPGLATSMNSPVAALERLKTAFILTMDTMLNDGLFSKLGEEFNRMTEMLKRADVQEFFVRMARGLGIAVGLMVDFMGFLAKHTDAVVLAFKALIAVSAVGTFDRLAASLFGLGNRMFSLSGMLPELTGKFRAMKEAATAASAASAVAISASGTTGIVGGAVGVAGGLAGVAGGAAAGSAATGIMAGAGAGIAGNSAVASARAAARVAKGLAPTAGIAIGQAATAGTVQVSLLSRAFMALGGAAGIATGAAVVGLGLVAAAAVHSSDQMVTYGEHTVTQGAMWDTFFKHIKDGWIGVADSTGDALNKMWDAASPDDQKVGKGASFLLRAFAGVTATVQSTKQLIKDVATGDWQNMRDADAGKGRGYITTNQVLAANAAETAAAENAKNGVQQGVSAGYGGNPAGYRDRGEAMRLSSQEVERRSAAFEKMMDTEDKVAKANQKYEADLKTINDQAQVWIQTGSTMEDVNNRVSDATEKAGERFAHATGMLAPFAEAMRDIEAATEAADIALSHLAPGQAGDAINLNLAARRHALERRGDSIQAAHEDAEFEKSLIGGDKKNVGFARHVATLRDKAMNEARTDPNGKSTYFQVQGADPNAPIPKDVDPKSLVFKDGVLKGLKADYDATHPEADHSGSAAAKQAHEQTAYEKLQSKYAPETKPMNDYKEAVSAVDEAKKHGIGNAAEYARILEGEKEKLLSSVAGMVPAIKAQNELNAAKQKGAGIDDMVKGGVLTPDQGAAAHASLAEHEKSLQDIIDPYSAYIRKLDEEHDAMQGGNLERQRAVALMKEEEKYKKATGQDFTPEQKAGIDDRLKRNQQDSWDDKQKSSGLQNTADSIGTFSNELGKVEEKIANELPNAFVKFVETGRLDWKKMVAGMEQDMAQMFARLAMKNLMEGLGLTGESGKTSPNGAVPTGGGLLTSGVNLLSKGIGSLFDKSPKMDASASNPLPAGQDGPVASATDVANSGGSSFSSIASSLGGVVSTAAKGIGSWISGLLSTVAPAAFEGGLTSGGILHAANVHMGAFRNAPSYAEGTHNVSGGGIPIIAHPNEAVIPLSRGRKIPVDMGGGNGQGGGRSNNNVTIHVHAEDPGEFHMAAPQIEHRMASALNRSTSRNGG